MTTRTLSRIPFDPREERIIAGLARWMGRLGRFQIVAATFVFVVLLAVTGIVTTVELIEPLRPSGETALVSIGEVSRGWMAAVVAGVVVLSLVFLRGGMLLLGAAEDLETVAADDDEDALDRVRLESALRRLRNYFVLESLLMIALVVVAYAMTIAGWG
ncbi:MAG: hypothetical protein AB7S26_20225 [Sandaracinaceae bacterium]